jgi:hypothetical protein
MQPDKNHFKTLVRRILKEEMGKDKESAVGVKSQQRVPEMDGNGVDPTKKNKTFASDANSRDVSNKETLLADLIEYIGKKDESVSIVWDDHDDIMVNGRDLKYIRVSPRWEDYYVIEMMTKNEDRVLVTGLTWQQTKDFVKNNLSGTTTTVEKAYDKSYRNREDQTPAPDKGLPQKDKPTIKPLTNETPKTTKNKDKDFTEDDVKKEADLPDKPMKEVGDFKKQDSHKVQDPVKLRKRKPDTKLTVKQS